MNYSFFGNMKDKKKVEILLKVIERVIIINDKCMQRRRSATLTRTPFFLLLFAVRFNEKIIIIKKIIR